MRSNLNWKLFVTATEFRPPLPPFVQRNLQRPLLSLFIYCTCIIVCCLYISNFIIILTPIQLSGASVMSATFPRGEQICIRFVSLIGYRSAKKYISVQKEASWSCGLLCTYLPQTHTQISAQLIVNTCLLDGVRLLNLVDSEEDGVLKEAEQSNTSSNISDQCASLMTEWNMYTYTLRGSMISDIIW